MVGTLRAPESGHGEESGSNNGRVSDTFDPDERDRLWLVGEAAAHFGGDTSAVLKALVRAARLAEQAPEDPWVRLYERFSARTTWPPYRVPVPALLEFAAYWQGRPGTAVDVVESLLGALTRRPGDEGSE